MLFHVTAVHDVDDCAAYNTEVQEQLLEFWGGIEALGDELGVQVLSWLADAPGHTVFMVLESGSVASVSKFLLAIPMRQDFDIRPVMQLETLAEMLSS